MHTFVYMFVYYPDLALYIQRTPFNSWQSSVCYFKKWLLVHTSSSPGKHPSKKRKNDFKPFFEQRQGFPPPWDLHQIAAIQCDPLRPPLASRFRKTHGVSRRLSLRSSAWSPPWGRGAWYSLQGPRGLSTSQGPSRQRKHTAVTVARLSQRKTFELSLRILAEWFLNRSGFCCEIHYTKVLMHRK
jgi:hypothetical protein